MERTVSFNIPINLSNSCPPDIGISEELLLAQKDRADGYKGRDFKEIAVEMKKIITEAENGR
ncbi:MAG: hypothetical protein FWF08_00150 [Oscillospiraceae bacterium]|nr:hypothetical protein [Oscillospiraceae bacterium]